MKSLFYFLLAFLFFSCGKTDTNNQTIVPTKRDERMIENKNSETTKSEEVKIKKTAADFEYDPNNELPEGVFEFFITVSDINKFNASKVLIKKTDIENFYKFDLQIIRNLIYARHGYIFKNSTFEDIFKKVDWYVPVSEDVSKELTEVELKNIELLKRYETNAKIQLAR